MNDLFPMNIVRSSIALSITLLLLSGCGDSGPGRVPVQGRIVMQDGMPVFPGSIALEPIGGSAFRSSALLHEEGEFKMRTYPHGDGVVPGQYKVVLSLGMGSPPELAKYSSAKTSTLELDVPEDGLKDFVLELEEVAQHGSKKVGPPGMQR